MLACPSPGLSWVLLPIASSSFLCPLHFWVSMPAVPFACLWPSVASPSEGMHCVVTPLRVHTADWCQSPYMVSHPASPPDGLIPCPCAPVSPNCQPFLNLLGSTGLPCPLCRCSGCLLCLEFPSWPSHLDLTRGHPPRRGCSSCPTLPTAPLHLGALVFLSACSLKTFEGSSFV